MKSDKNIFQSIICKYKRQSKKENVCDVFAERVSNFNDQSIISEQEYRAVLMGIMEKVDSFCRENYLKYYMVGGTLLGAVRHKGFIPWDDDIDIAMKREDYERFCKSFNGCTKDYRVVNLNNTKNYYTYITKVVDTRTSLKENAFQSVELGAYIDVFPLDYISKDNYKKAINLLDRCSLTEKIKSVKTMNLSSRRSIIKNMVIVLSRVLCWSSAYDMAVDYDRKARALSSDDSSPYVANLYGAWGKREITDAVNFQNTIELEFEGRFFWAPCGYDDYLKGVYGDYMIPPPKEKQITHHDFRVYWKEEYRS